MSFYTANPFHSGQQRQPLHHGYYAQPQPTFNFFPPAPPAFGHQVDDDIDAEEIAALAHLRSIQQRRELAQAAARREAAIHARIAAEPIAAAVQRQEAIRQKAAREEGIRRAIAIEHQRRAVALEQHHRALAARQQLAAQRAIEQKKAECVKRRNACRCAGTGDRVQQDRPQLDDVNTFLQALFGLTLDGSTNKVGEKEVGEKKDVKEGVEAAQTVEEKEGAKDLPKETIAPPTAPAPVSATDVNDDHKAHTSLNDLISNFLGYTIEPAASNEKSTEGAADLTNELNNFLGQFGLEFEPLKHGESSTSKPVPASTKAAPATDSAPQVETSDKGKEVAKGERPARSTSEVDTSSALNKLRDISHELHLATESFNFPSQLAFAATPSADEVTPPLLFNKGNSGYHAQAHKLLQLLLAADGVSSGGDREVRKQRKAIVKAIEGAIEKLEEKRDQVWRDVKEKREQGVESDDDGSVSSWATESTAPQHVEDVATEDSRAPTYAQVAVKPVEEEKVIEGFSVDQDAKTSGETTKLVQQSEKEEDSAPQTKDNTKTDEGNKEDFELV